MTQRNEWIFGEVKNVLDDKQYLLKHIIIQMLNQTTKMFKYSNLPETVNSKDIEIQLQVGGYNTWKVVKDNLYTFRSGLGGEPNPYYLPTISTVANPALKYTENLEIDKNCVVMLNDHFYEGLMPLHNKYGSLLVEAEISLKYAIINARVPSLIQADNDNTYESAKEFFKKITEGKDYGIILNKGMFDGIKSHDFYQQQYIKDLIESIQYIKGSWYNALGLNAVFNMKREAINEFEANMNEDILYPTIDTMLECRKIGLEKVNKMYGLDISVELDSAWNKSRKEDNLNIELQEATIEDLKNEKGENEVEIERDSE